MKSVKNWSKQVLFTLMLILAAGSLSLDPALSASSEDVVLNFRATDLQGQPFDGLSLKGKTVLLDFWAVWCLPCIKAIPILNRLDRDLESLGFEVVGIATYSGTVEEVRKFAAGHDPRYTMLVGEDELADRMGIFGYPTYLLIGPEGTIRKTYFGEVENLYEEITARVAAILHE